MTRRIVFVRHGETEKGSSTRYFGRTDVALSDLGREQLRRARRALLDEAFDHVYTSTLRRTREGAEILAPGVPSTALADFDEIHFGEWEGLTEEEIATRYPEAFARWRRAPGDFAYPGGDDAREFRRRVASAIRRLLPRMPPRVLVVAHKGVIRAAVTELLALSEAERRAWPCDLASIHVLAERDGTWQAEVVNDTRHLADLPS
ncbi:MAG: alpha-ribazole phosphatase [Candidatus Binatia bacterium]|nr:MAG: alpha-ribazole phosphatase [Candidatus Binatia bacterium]